MDFLHPTVALVPIVVHQFQILDLTGAEVMFSVPVQHLYKGFRIDQWLTKAYHCAVRGLQCIPCIDTLR